MTEADIKAIASPPVDSPRSPKQLVPDLDPDHPLKAELDSLLKTLSKKCVPQLVIDSEQALQRERRLERLACIANFPARHAAKTVVLPKPADEQLQRLKKDSSDGFLVCLKGKRGPGKTQLAVELMKWFIYERAWSARYCTATEFFMIVKKGYCDQRPEEDVVREFQRFRLLVIDEIGRRGQTDWENDLLFELLDRRYRDQSNTLVITNEDDQALNNTLGAGLLSRLNETGGLIECGWPSYRPSA